MIRLHVIVEGQTEESFVNRVLAEHLGSYDIFVNATCFITKRKKGEEYKGGVVSYAQVKRDIQNRTKEDRGKDVRFTSMIDLFRLPSDFPSFDKFKQVADPYVRIEGLEKAFGDDIADPRFIPYLQLYEFEALLLSDPRKFSLYYPDQEKSIRKIIKMTANFASPELINDGPKTAPSKRIAAILPAYSKTAAGPTIAGYIGLSVMCSKCPHFDQWLKQLESLAEPPSAPPAGAPDQ